jgi:hypothetical protein
MSDVLSQFNAFKLHGMTECYAELQAQGQAGTSEDIGSTAPRYFVNYWPQKRLIEVYGLYGIR